MAITPKVFIAQQQAAAVQTTYYTAPTGARTRIDKFTGTNAAASNVTISIWLVSSGGTAGNSNLIVDTKTIVPDECYLFPELVGQWLQVVRDPLGTGREGVRVRCHPVGRGQEPTGDGIDQLGPAGEEPDVAPLGDHGAGDRSRLEHDGRQTARREVRGCGETGRAGADDGDGKGGVTHASSRSSDSIRVSTRPRMASRIGRTASMP